MRERIVVELVVDEDVVRDAMDLEFPGNRFDDFLREWADEIIEEILERRGHSWWLERIVEGET